MYLDNAWVEIAHIFTPSFSTPVQTVARVSGRKEPVDSVKALTLKRSDRRMLRNFERIITDSNFGLNA
jgi:hypothetical protein